MGTIPGRSVNSAKSVSVHFIPVLNGPSNLVPQKIFLPIEKHKSVPYLTSSVANGIENMFVFKKYSLDKDIDFGKMIFDKLRSFDPVYARHFNIH